MRKALLVLCGLLGGLLAGPAPAQDYPSRLIKLVVAFPAGSFSDVVARAVADRASKILAQPIICLLYTSDAADE